MKTKFILFIFFPLFFFLSCQKEELPEVPANRTVLFYFAGDNNLSFFLNKNVEMIKAGILKDEVKNGNILIYEDFRGQIPHLYQLKLNKDTIQQIEIESFDIDQNSASVETLSMMIDKVQAKFPAESYGLVLSSHGTGWLPSDLDKYLRSFGHDGNGNKMDINDLSDALSKYHFDFILFDACNMACTEVAYALRSCTDYIIASPNEILTDGFPFNKFMGDLFEKEADLVSVATEFYNFYQNDSGSIALIKTDGLNTLAVACHNIFKSKTEEELLAINPYELQFMEGVKRGYHTLYDFDDYISHLATPEQYDTFKRCLDQIIIYKACTPRIFFEKYGYVAINKFSGLSIYVPQKELSDLNEWYKKLDWYKDVFK